MPKIGYYDLTTAANGDLVLISETDVNGVAPTKTVTAQSIAQLAGATGQNLEATLGFGNVATNDITLNGNQLINGTLTVNVVDIAAGNADNLILGANVRNTAAVTTLDASGLTTLATDLTVGNDAAITNDLGVGGNTTIIGTLGVTGDTTLSANAGVTGNTTMTGTLGVTGLATLATVDINGGAVDGTVIGAGVASTINCTTLAATGAISSGGDIAAGNAMSFTVDPTGAGGPIVGLECRSATGCNIQFVGIAPAFPDETHVNAIDGITLSPGTGNVTITTNLIDSPGSTNVAIDAAVSGTTVVTRDYVNNRASDWDIDMGGNDVKYENTVAFVVSDAPIVAVNPGIGMGYQGTDGFFQMPSMTTAQISAAEALLTVPGAMAFNTEHSAYRAFNGTDSNFLAQSFDTENLNAVNSPLTPANSTVCVLCDNSAGSVELDLNRIHTINFTQGKRYIVKGDGNTSSNNYIKIEAWLGNTIDGSTDPIFITEPHGSVTLTVMSATNWAITSDFNFNTARVYSASGTLTGAQILTLDGTMGNAITLVPAKAGAILRPIHVNVVPLAAGNPDPYGPPAPSLATTMCIYASDLPTPNPTHEFASLMTVINHSPGYSMPITPVASLDLTEAQYTVSDSIKLSNEYSSGAITHGAVPYDMNWELTYTIDYV